MLEGLDRVPWESLTHAYGPAADVPNMLRALASADAEEREDALWALYGNIWHQGTVYEATAHAVPFLYELVRDPAVGDREKILQLLHAIAYGSSYLDAHQHLSYIGPKLKESPTFDEELKKELSDVEAAYLAVNEGHPILLRLLAEDRDPAVRRHAAKMLGSCMHVAAKIAPELAKRTGLDADPYVRASIAFALAKLDFTAARAMIEQELVSAEPIARLAAALAIAHFSESAPSKPAVEVLAKHLGDLTLVDYEQFPFGEDQASDLGTALARAEPEQRTSAAHALLERAEKKEAALFSVVGPLLALAFAEPLENPRLEDLSPLQKRVLELVAQNTFTRIQGSWCVFANFCDSLRAYGLDKLGELVAGYTGP